MTTLRQYLQSHSYNQPHYDGSPEADAALDLYWARVNHLDHLVYGVTVNFINGSHFHTHLTPVPDRALPARKRRAYDLLLQARAVLEKLATF